MNKSGGWNEKKENQDALSKTVFVLIYMLFSTVLAEKTGGNEAPSYRMDVTKEFFRDMGLGEPGDGGVHGFQDGTPNCRLFNILQCFGCYSVRMDLFPQFYNSLSHNTFWMWDILKYPGGLESTRSSNIDALIN